jgi:diguanylate cyclase (GGDEF)-like protein
MLRTQSSILEKVLAQLKQATLDHAVWRDHLLRVFSGRKPCDPNDLAADAHRYCLFGRWYFEQALPELRELPSFAMIGAEHVEQHRIAARLLRSMTPGVPVVRTAIEEFEEASARLSYALYFVKREIECALHSRDSLTDAHSSDEILRDLREWHALVRQPGWECCIALMELDDVPKINATHGYSVGGQTLVTTVKIISAHLRPSDKVFRYDASKFLIRLSGTDLGRGKTVITRIRETITNGLTSVGGDGVASDVTTSFGIAMLDPEVDALESIDRADQALTLAKAAGGNRVITWDPSVTTGVRLRRLELKDLEG